jgi:hypothetical protein
MHTLRLLSLCLLGGVLSNPGHVLGQGRDHRVPAPFPQPNFRAFPLDSAALARTNIDRMPIFKPDLSQLANMPVLKIDSLDRFPMPQLKTPHPRPYVFEPRQDARKPGR